jgi:hypothetical protein
MGAAACGGPPSPQVACRQQLRSFSGGKFDQQLPAPRKHPQHQLQKQDWRRAGSSTTCSSLDLLVAGRV